MIRILKHMFLLMSMGVFLPGCTHEKVEECYSGLQLNFDFALHTDEGNRFDKEVQVVRVYLFDSENVLRKIQTGQGSSLDNDYVMHVDIPPGKYTVIAWGGSDIDFSTSFHEGHMNDPLTHDYSAGVTEGKTTLDDFRIFLNYNLADEYPEDAVPQINEFADLYYGAVGERQKQTSDYLFEKVEVKSGTITQRRIELIRNTNLIKIKVTGLKYLVQHQINRKPEKLNIWISARNARFRYDNTIGEYARMVRYTPFVEEEKEDTLTVDIKTLRIDMKRHTADPVYLSFQENATGVIYPQKPIDILNLLLQARDPQTGKYIYESQEDLDRIYEHPVRIDISADLHIRLFIHDWEVVYLYPDIE